MTTEYGDSEHGRAALLRAMIEEKGGIDRDLYHPDVVSYRPWDVVAHTLAASQDSMQAERGGEFDAEFTVRRMYSDAKVTVEEAEEDGDEVRLRWRLEGIHAHSFNGVKATDERVNATGHTTYRFSEGKIVEVWGAVDCSSLGAICPETVQALTRARTLQGACLVRPEESIQPRA